MSVRRSDSRRHPVFEWTVFGLAAVLALFLTLHGARRYLAGRVAEGPPRVTPPLAPLVPGEAAPAGSATEAAVTALPPVRLSSTGGARRWKADVPSPGGSRK